MRRVARQHIVGHPPALALATDVVNPADASARALFINPGASGDQWGHGERVWTVSTIAGGHVDERPALIPRQPDEMAGRLVEPAPDAGGEQAGGPVDQGSLLLVGGGSAGRDDRA